MSVNVCPTIDALKTTLGLLATEQAALVAALTALRTGNAPDYSAISKSEDGGSQSWSMATLQDRLATVSAQLMQTAKDIGEIQKMAPYAVHVPLRRCHFGNGFC